MSRFGNLAQLPTAQRLTATVPARTGEGGVGFTSADPRGALFTAAVSGLLADGFYEKAGERLDRVRALARAAALDDPDWTRQFAVWLREGAHLRSAPLVVALEYAAVSQETGGLSGVRDLVATVCQRADEPGEALAYWRHFHRRAVPSSVQRGLADAVTRLYTERAAARYDGTGKAYRFGDVIEVVHPRPKDARQSLLFRWLLDRRRHPAEPVPQGLVQTADLRRFTDATPALRAEWRDHLYPQHPYAGTVTPPLLSWEALAADTPGGLDARWWETLVREGRLGLLALLRNLNNLDRAGVSDPAAVAEVQRRLSDPAEVLSSRVLPYRFLTAYVNSESDRWREALTQGAEHAMANLPAMPGHTLLMVDCSGSMAQPVAGGKSRNPLTRSQLAGFVAESLGRRCARATIVCYDSGLLSTGSPAHHVPVLRAAAGERYRPHGNTMTWSCTVRALQTLESRPDRVVVVTDEQSSDHDDGRVQLPVVTWNISGDRVHHAAHGQAPNRFLVAGYSDTALELLPATVLRGSTGRWPWEVTA